MSTKVRLKVDLWFALKKLAWNPYLLFANDVTLKRVATQIYEDLVDHLTLNNKKSVMKKSKFREAQITFVLRQVI